MEATLKNGQDADVEECKRMRKEGAELRLPILLESRRRFSTAWKKRLEENRQSSD